MKIAVASTHSDDNIALARLTSRNRWEYSAKHHYDLITFRRPWPEMETLYLRELADATRHWDAVLHIGSDVVVTNPEIRVEDLVLKGDHVVVSSEIEGRARFNFDISIWCNTDLTRELLHNCADNHAKWTAIEGSWQTYVTDLMDSGNPLGAAMRLVAPRVLNSTDQSGEWLWSPGDFVCHFLGGTTESKIERINTFLPDFR